MTGQAQEQAQEQKRPVVVISGIGPTAQMYSELDKTFDVAVFDQQAAQQIAGIVGKGVLCPRMGAGAPLVDRARNDSALIIGEIVNELPHLHYSLDGKEPKILSDMSTWLPGLTALHVPELLLSLRTLDAFIKEREVVAVIVHEDVTPRFRALALWARAHDIPSIHVPHGNCFARVRPDIHDTSVCDWILAASPYMRDWYTARGFVKRRIKVTGFPTWDRWLDITERIDQPHARRALHLDLDKPTLQFCTQWAQRTNFVDDHTAPEAMPHLALGAVQKLGWQMIWTLHPGDGKDHEQACANLAAAYRVPALVTRGHLALAIRAADVVLSAGPSNVLVEVGFCDRPPVVYPLRGYGFDGEPPYLAGMSVDETVTALERALDRGNWEQARAGFVRRYAYRNDGKASARAARQVRKIINSI